MAKRSASRSGSRSPAKNLSDEGRRKGGERSASEQQRNERGQFAGKEQDESFWPI